MFKARFMALKDSYVMMAALVARPISPGSAEASGYGPGMGTRRYAMYIETLAFFLVIAAVFGVFFMFASRATHRDRNA